MKRTLAIALLLVIALLAVLIIRAETRFADHQVAPLPPAVLPAVDETGAIRRLSRAIGIPTVSHDDRRQFDAPAFRSFHSFLEDAYPRVHATLERHLVSEYSLVYHLRGSDPDQLPVLFMGHFDVVPIDPATAEQWRFDPFSGELAEGRIWGRGSVDDKLGVIALLEAMEVLLAEGWRPARSVYLAFGHDEEVGGLDGAREVARWFENRGTRFEFVLDEGGIVTEGIFDAIDPPVAVIGVAEKGWVNVELTVRSPGGHSSQPPRQTAVGILSQAIVELERKPSPATLEFLSMTIDAIGHALPWRLRLLFANRWLFGPLIERQMLRDSGNAAGLRTTTAATMISGSPKSNILPTKASAVVNFRIIPGETAASVRDRVARIIDDERVELSLGTHWDPSPMSSVDSAPFRMIAGTIRALDPHILVAPYLVRGGTDARYFHSLSPNVYRFLMARADPSTIEHIHGINESVAVSDFLSAISFYHALMVRAAGS